MIVIQVENVGKILKQDFIAHMIKSNRSFRSLALKWPHMGVITTELVIVFLLILLNSLFALSEMAIVSARKTRLQQRAEGGDRGARAALDLSEEPTRFLSTVQIGITLIGILSGAFGGATIAETIANALSRIPWLAPYSEAIGVGVVVLVITYLSLVVGELVPKRIALNNAESIAVRVAAPMTRLSRWARPAVTLLSHSTDAVLRLLGIKPSDEPMITEEEIKLMIYEGARTGIFEEAEREILGRVFRLGDRKVSTLMTYRTELVWLDIDDPMDDNLQKVAEAGYSRFAVCRGNPDDVLGFIQVKDLFARSLSNEPIDLAELIRPANFIPESMSALELLDYFRERKDRMALVVDEFGGVAGLVTLNDVLEAIVGDIPTVADHYEPEVIRREDGSLLLDGALSIEELKELLRLEDLPEEEEAGYETLGGMLMAQFGRIPATGDYLELKDLRFEVVDMDGYRVDKVLVSAILNHSGA
jgi:putative hemolysin